MSSRFRFFEVVVVAANDDMKLQSMIGQEGTILGIAHDDVSKCWSYSVSMASTGEVWNFDERQLASTGRQQNRLDHYSGDAVKVHVDPTTGKGLVK